MIDQSTLEGRIVAAAFRLAGERAWRTVTLRDIAEAAGVTLAEVSREFSSKTEILVAFNRSIDDTVLRNAPKAADGQALRDALFEVVMARFDALTPYRTAVKSIVTDAGGDGRLAASLLKSQRWMLQAAGIDSEGVRGGIRIAGLASVYAGVFRIWLEDDDPGLARTMAALDRRLRSGERTLSNIEDACSMLGRFTTAARELKRRVRWRADTSATASSAPPADESGAAATS